MLEMHWLADSSSETGCVRHGGVTPPTAEVSVNRWLTLGLILALAGAAFPARAQTSATVVEIAASLHVLVLLSDGSVVALGDNRSGQLGRPKVIRSFLPAERVPLPAKAVQVAAGEDTSFALLDDGTVWAWGRGVYRTLGVELAGATERHTPEPIPKLQGVSQIVANGNTAMALMADGTVRAWGELPASLTGGRAVHPGVSPPLPLPGLENIARITGAPSMGFALTKDGRAIGWGQNDRGSLGLGHVTPEPQRPTELPLKDVVSIATVFGATAAVTRDGRVWTWGDNSQAGLGNGLHGDTSTPVSRRRNRSRASPTRSRSRPEATGATSSSADVPARSSAGGTATGGSSVPASPATTSLRRRRSLSRASKPTGSGATSHSPGPKTARSGSGVSSPARRGCSV